MVGRHQDPTRVSSGSASFKSWSRLGLSSTPRYVMPVMVPPGRARLWTMPAATGSDTPEKTIGMSGIGDQNCVRAAASGENRPIREGRWRRSDDDVGVQLHDLSGRRRPLLPC